MIDAITFRGFGAARVRRRFGIMVAFGLCWGVLVIAELPAGQPAARHPAHACQHCGGRCGPHCPVRPGLYGFYGTQWRQWPGQGFMASQESPAATPVQPPRLAVPGPDEESIQPRKDSEEESSGPTQPPAEDLLVPLPAPKEPDAPPPPAEPEPPQSPLPPAAPAPLPLTPSSSTPEDENLFNTRYRPKSMRKLSMGMGGAKAQAEDPVVQATTLLKPAAVKKVPRVSFDPAEEGQQLRIRIK